jgi:endonuclease YncB( thermonuclease family)
MFGWRKKNDGFDWQAYVRTTIKLRREARRERIDAARQAALNHAHAAGEALAAGSKMVGAAALDGAHKGASGGARGVAWLGRKMLDGLNASGGVLGGAVDRVGGRMQTTLGGWAGAGPAALVGVIALASGGYQVATTGFEATSAIPLGLGALLLLLAAPSFMMRVGLETGRGMMAGVATILVIATGWTAWRYGAPAASLASLPNVGALLPVAVKPVEGRATALGGDVLRLQGQVFTLSGIEAPDRSQACVQGRNRRWKCGERAVSALETALRSGPVACTPRGAADAAGRLAATCTLAGEDLAARLVREGHVFAAAMTFGGYGVQESEARMKKAGLWSGNPERPAAYRARLWETAKKTSPEGCPIKGTVQAGIRIFVQPWDSGYRRASVRANRGERWFCSEADAIAAGFRAVQPRG